VSTISEHPEPILSAHLSCRRTHPHTGARLRRITAALAAVTCGLLAMAAAVPAAVAAIIPVPDGPYGPAVPPGSVPVIAADGMPGWQITLIALASALIAATAAVFLDRARASRRSGAAS
jgi:hypothetical protein